MLEGGLKEGEQAGVGTYVNEEIFKMGFGGGAFEKKERLVVCETVPR